MFFWAECFCEDNGDFYQATIFDHWECFDDVGNTLGYDQESCAHTWAHVYLTCEMLDMEMQYAPHLCDHVQKSFFVRECCTGN